MLTGNLRQLQMTACKPVGYMLHFNQHPPILLNDHLGKTMTFQFSNYIQCIHCGRKAKQSFNQGYCFVCFRKLARCDHCMIKPELCHFANGTCREPDWGTRVCMKKHIVYMSYTSGIKIGITRKINLPMRWLDQGATLALPLFEVKTRLHSGLIEVILKQYFNDRTQWKKMLQYCHYHTNLTDLWNTFLTQHQDALQAQFNKSPRLNNHLPASIAQYHPISQFHYPRLDATINYTAVNITKKPEFSGRLLGMKGQYLLFDTGVLNIRKHTGYYVSLQIF